MELSLVLVHRCCWLPSLSHVLPYSRCSLPGHRQPQVQCFPRCTRACWYVMRTDGDSDTMSFPMSRVQYRKQATRGWSVLGGTVLA